MNAKRGKQDQSELSSEERVLRLVRAIARAVGPLLFLLMVISGLSQGGIDRLLSLSISETVSLMAVIFMFFGIFWAYQNELPGGIVILIGYLAHVIVEGSLFPNPLIPLFLLTGVLHVYAGLKQRKIDREERFQ